MIIYMENIYPAHGRKTAILPSSDMVPLKQFPNRWLMIKIVMFFVNVVWYSNEVFFFKFQDVYVLVCMLIQVLIAIQNSFSSLWSDPLDKNAKLFDTISAAILAGLSILFHVIYGFIILMKVS